MSTRAALSASAIQHAHSSATIVFGMIVVLLVLAGIAGLLGLRVRRDIDRASTVDGSDAARGDWADTTDRPATDGFLRPLPAQAPTSPVSLAGGAATSPLLAAPAPSGPRRQIGDQTLPGLPSRPLPPAGPRP